MDVLVARKLSRAPSIPFKLQEALWETGDTAARLALARTDLLSTEVEGRILAERDEELIAAWAHGRGRKAEDIEKVCAWVTQDRTLHALAALEKLTPRALDYVVSKATPSVAASLLDRADLTDAHRANLMPAFLDGIESSAALAGRVVAERLGESPRVWVEAIRYAYPRHITLLGIVPWSVIDNEHVQDSIIEFLGQASGTEWLDLHSASAVGRCLKMLIGSPSLSVERSQEVLAIVEALRPELDDLARRRSQVNLPKLVQAAACAENCSANTEHVQAVSVLLNLAAFVSLDLAALFSSAMRHIDSIDRDLLGAVAAQLRGDKALPVLRGLETAHGPSSREVLEAVRLLGVWPTSALSEPTLVFKELAQCGWEDLTRAHYVPPALVDIVALNYVPVAGILVDPTYAESVCRHLSAVDPRAGHTALSLLGEWSGSLAELLECCRALSVPDED